MSQYEPFAVLQHGTLDHGIAQTLYPADSMQSQQNNLRYRFNWKPVWAGRQFNPVTVAAR